MSKNPSQISELPDDMSAKKLIKLYRYIREQMQYEVDISDSYAKANLKIVEQALKSDQNDFSSIEVVYGALEAIAQVKPELADRVLIDIEEALKSDKNGEFSLLFACDALCTVVTSNSKSADRVSTILEKLLIDDDRDVCIPDSIGSHLIYRMIYDPDTADCILPVVEKFRKSDKKWDFIGDATDTIVRVRPDLVERVLTNIEETGVGGFSILGTIAQIKPELTDRVLTDIVKKLKSDKSDSTRNYGRYINAEYVLEKMIAHNHKIVDRVFPILKKVRKDIKEIFNTDQNGEISSERKECKEEAPTPSVKTTLRQRRKGSYS